MVVERPVSSLPEWGCSVDLAQWPQSGYFLGVCERLLQCLCRLWDTLGNPTEADKLLSRVPGVYYGLLPFFLPVLNYTLFLADSIQLLCLWLLGE